MSVAAQNESRLHFLLIVRVVATFAVVFGHASSFYRAFSLTQWPNFPYIQSVSVTVFFCVSGYTIAWVCDRSGRLGMEGLGSFTFDRVARLHIPLVPFLLICAIIEPMILGDSHPYRGNLSATSLIGNFLFLQWLLPDFIIRSMGTEIQPYGLNRPLWTLAIEFWTYILFAGVFFGTRTRPWRLSAVLIGIGAAVILGTTIYSGHGKGLPVIWLLGAAAYFSMRNFPPINQTARLIAAIVLVPTVLLIFTPAMWPATGDYSWPFNLLIFSCFVLLLILVSATNTTPGRLTSFFGSFAYSVYITHYPVMYLLHQSGVLPSGAAGAIGASGLCLAFGWAYSLPLEQRYKLIRERIKTWTFSKTRK